MDKGVRRQNPDRSWTSADGKGRVARLHHYSRVAADDPAPSDVARVDVISPRVQVLHLA